MAEGETQYNIPVSSKQLIVYFVFLVIALSAAFLAGVMVGRNADSSPEPTVRDIQDRGPDDLPASPTPDTLTYGSLLQGDKIEGLSPGSGAGAEPSPTRPATTAAAPLPAPSAKASPSTTRKASDLAKPIPLPAKPVPTPNAGTQRPTATATSEVARPKGKASPKPTPKSTPAGTAKTRPTPLSRLTIQVGAFKDRSAADAIVKRLKGKGYSAYVVPVMEGLFNVRVGSFTDREDAERILAKLESQEKFKPFIVKP